MTTLIRRFVDLLTFGLVGHLDSEIETQTENVKRVAAGKPRLNPISNSAFPERRKGRRR